MKLFNEGLTDVQRINRRLQAAIDHYPQLAAFRFSLQQPNRTGPLNFQTLCPF